MLRRSMRRAAQSTVTETTSAYFAAPAAPEVIIHSEKPRKRASYATSTSKPKRSRTNTPAASAKAASTWQLTYEGIKTYRQQLPAPVDNIGCHMLGDRHRGPKTFRFQTLVALMLSAQTKDAVTAEAMRQLRAHFDPAAAADDANDHTQLKLAFIEDTLRSEPFTAGQDKREGFTAWQVMAAPVDTIDHCITKVGFHRRKAQFIQATAQLCVEQHAGDIPNTLEGLLALPGVGPKMAFLTLQAAWGQHLGLGVDTHVHRISNRLGWVKTKTPEQTREALEALLPEEYWPVLNPLLVGFGQTTCLPVRPQCAQCPVRLTCPSSTSKKP